MKRFVLFCLFFVFIFTVITPVVPSAETVSEKDILALFEKSEPHPRLLMNATQEESVRKRINTEDNAKALFNIIKKNADGCKDAPFLTYKKTGKRLLSVSREALYRILNLSFVYRMTGDHCYAEQAIVEMEAAAAFSDWNPSHFLDVAEMTAALAIGYDWLYEELGPEQKQTVHKAIVDKGIQASYHGTQWWVKGNNNWNQVCHGGMVFGSLALLEEEPDLAAKTIHRAVIGLPHAMKEYMPDGIYPEGPSYWQYGTTYNVLLIAALESALGTDFGIATAPGFLESGAFPLLMTGPTGDHFNFSDCGHHGGPYPAVYWFAQRTGDAGLAWYEHPWLEKVLLGEASARNRFLAMLMIWWDGKTPPAPSQPLHWRGAGINPLAVHRSSWKDPNAIFLAVKAGTPYANHGHMDVGSFVLEADGVRWAIDFGSQGYHSLESLGMNIWDRNQNSDRWKVYRYHNRSHNTLLADDIGQVVKGKSAITGFSDAPSFPYTIMDMSEVYKKQLAHAERGFVLFPDGRILIQDEITATDKPAKVRWAMTTSAEIITRKPGTATLVQKDKRLYLKTLSPADITIETFSTTSPNDWDAPNPGSRQVGFHIELEPKETNTIAVLLTPGSVADKLTGDPEIQALKTWRDK